MHPIPAQIPRALPRRSFLAAGAALLSARTLSGLAASPEGRRLRAGFLGTAYSHFAEKYRVLRRSTAFEVVGLCEEDAAVRARGPEDARWVTSEQLLAETEVVLVESMPQLHAAHAKLALLAGRHVHLEKPPADSLPAFQELLDLAREKQRLLQIGYMWRYNPGINAALEAARKGWLGDVFLVRATMNTFLDASRRPEWAPFRGGAMFEQGCHLIDILVRLLGRPLRVVPFLKTSAALPDHLADNTLAVFEYPRAWGIITSAPLDPNAGPGRFLEILGTHGSARVQPLEPPRLVIELKEPAGPYRAGRQEVPQPEYHRYADEFDALAAAVRQGQPLPVPPELERDIQEALLRACDMA